MGIGPSSAAAGVASGVQNMQFSPLASVMQRKILVMGTGLPASYTANGVATAVPQLILNPKQAATLYGAGSMLHRLIKQVFAGNNYNCPVYAFPETDTGTAAVFTTTFTGTTTAAGTLYMYVNGVLYPVAVPSGTAATAIPALCIAAINADPDVAVIASGTTTLINTAKSKGLWGNGITIAFNQWPQNGEAFPAGITAASTVATTPGAGVPTVATDMSNGLGVGSNQNADGYTDVVHGYMTDATTLQAISTYNGVANGFTGNFDRIVGRPFRCLTGDITPAAAGLTAALAVGTANTSDRTNGIISAPGSLTHPAEIAAVAIGEMARINAVRAQDNYDGVVLPGVDPGNIAFLAGNRWTDQYSNRDQAVKGGVSPTVVEGGAVKLQNVMTFYAANSSVVFESNLYKEMRNISIVQNIINAKMLNYKGPKWSPFTVVSDSKKVTDSYSRLTARSRDDIIDDEIALAKSFEAKGWIYTADFSITALKNPATVQTRVGGDGFTINTPYILSGSGHIIDSTALLDTSIAVLSN